ncbi:hypothetical protein ACIGXM_14650 [Kitasatospora sp. NPDC052896]|uniref:hypothetical protein n=1 Tax=Kitasatospora sp. NPDC052896 TaxID=3364061 RepID=UPI0037CBF149
MNKCDEDPLCQGNEEITLFAYVRRDQHGVLYLHELNPHDVQSVEHDVDEDHAHAVTATVEQHDRMLPELEALAEQVVKPRLITVTDRDMNGGTHTSIFINGIEVEEHEYYTVDPGADFYTKSHITHEWAMEQLDRDGLPAAVQAKIREIVTNYHECSDACTNNETNEEN